MTLSICCPTYNHEKFIAQALDSFLLQETNFEFDIVIGDDCSTDGTLSICRAYQQKYPGKVKLLPSETNMGMIPNFVRTLKSCTGKYVAMCEGDDYWTNPLKLQTQVDFLEANAAYAICFHRVQNLANGQLVESTINTSATEETYTINNLASGNFIHTPSVVFRNHLFNEFPQWFFQSALGDYVLHMINAKYGLIKYFPQQMAVYRYHDGGVWSAIERGKKLEKGIWVINALLTYDFEEQVKEILLTHRRKLTETYLKLLMKAPDWKEFISKLSFYSQEDDYIAQKWLTEYYPAYVNTLKSSKTYKAAQYFQKRISTYKKRLGM